MQGMTHTINAQITIRAPFNNKGRQPDVMTDEMLGRYLRQITVSNALGEPSARFTVEFTPEVVPGTGGLSMSQLIQPYSLVSIALHRGGSIRPGQPGHQANTLSPKPMLLGIVDDLEESEDYSEEAPRRDNELSGRSLSGVLSDHRWWFHSFLAYSGQINLPPDIRDFFAVRPDDVLLRDESSLRTLGFLAIDPHLFDVSGRTPAALMGTAWNFFVEGTAERSPFIKCRWDSQTSLGRATNIGLSRLLRFDAEAAHRNYFDPAARMVNQYLGTELPDASCWDLLDYFSDEHFNELFSDTVGDNLHNAYVQVVSRKPPFAGHIEYINGHPRIRYSSGTQRPREGQSLFDTSFGDWNLADETVEIDGSDVIAMPQLGRGVGEGTYNLYDVQPAVFANAGARTGDRMFQQEIPPIIDEILSSPSYVERVGIRPLRVASRSIPMLDAVTNDAPRPVADLREHCLVYAALLREWHFRQPELWRGTYFLKGRTALRVGKRLLDKRSPDRWWEFYIRRVQHQITFEEQPFYSTTVQVDRGWPINPGS